MAATIPQRQVRYNNPPQSTGRNITAFQKSISAISGAILTSLIVTPLDVVRVRLQSQQPAAPIPSSPLNGARPRLGYSTMGPENKMGVTTCCREVFFSRSWNANGTAVQCDYPPYQSSIMQNGACAAEETGKRSFQGTWEGLVKIARYEGITSLWRGLSPTLYSTSTMFS